MFFDSGAIPFFTVFFTFHVLAVYGGPGRVINPRDRCPEETICFIPPCDPRYFTCPAFPRARCRVRCPCGSRFFFRGFDVTDRCQGGGDGDVCPWWRPQVNCFVDPCQISECPIRGAVCRSDYCGGCRARWYVRGRERTRYCEFLQNRRRV